MKRFWQAAAVVAGPDGFTVELDGKPVRLPGGTPLLLATESLALAVAGEWQEAGPEFDMDELRLTQLAGTAQERVAADPASVALAVARYAESDLLCYRAAAPLALVEREARLWQPWLDWAARRYGARLVATEGVRHVAQDRLTLAILTAAVAACDTATLAALGVMVPALGSIVLGLAVADGAVSWQEAFDLSILNELFQAEQWGEDAQAAARRAGIAADIAASARFVELAHA